MWLSFDPPANLYIHCKAYLVGKSACKLNKYYVHRTYDLEVTSHTLQYYTSSLTLMKRIQVKATGGGPTLYPVNPGTSSVIKNHKTLQTVAHNTKSRNMRNNG